MSKELNNFKKYMKKYIDYIMTLDFKKLGIHFLSLAFSVFICLLTYIPVSLVADLVIQFMGILPLNISTIVFSIVDWIFLLISFIIFASCFVYMFNRRYEELYNEEINTEMKKEVKENKVEDKIESIEKTIEENDKEIE